MTAGIPRKVDDVTASWLAGVLAVDHPNLQLRNVDVVEVIHGTATKVRLALDHDGDTTVPTGLCLKAGLEEHSDMTARTGIYANEARFFREIRDGVGAPAPQWYWADWDDASQAGALLMEDLARPGVRFCHAAQPLTIDEADAALGALAAFHSARFGADVTTEWPWLPWMVVESQGSAEYFRTLGPDVIAAELAKPDRGQAVPSGMHDPEQIVEWFWRWVATNREGPVSLIHGDAHIGNLYIDGSTPAFCDWQTIRYGRPMLDVAYFLGSALTTSDRRDSERLLVASYRERLAAQVDGLPSLDELWFDYRRNMMYGFFAWLTNLDVYQAEEITVTTIERFATALVDLETTRTF
jgi:hypothetical protein